MSRSWDRAFQPKEMAKREDCETRTNFAFFRDKKKAGRWMGRQIKE